MCNNNDIFSIIGFAYTTWIRIYNKYPNPTQYQRAAITKKRHEFFRICDKYGCDWWYVFKTLEWVRYHSNPEINIWPWVGEQDDLKKSVKEGKLL